MLLNHTVIFEPQPDGGYTVYMPSLTGYITEGVTLKEAGEMIRDAIKCCCESRVKDGLTISGD